MINYNNESLNMCQICLKEQPTAEHDLNTIWNNTITFQKMISFLINENYLQEEDLSTKICDECEKTLIISYKFKELCLTSAKNNKKILENLNNAVKVEGIDTTVVVETSEKSAETWLGKEEENFPCSDESNHLVDDTTIDNPVKSESLNLDGNFRYCRQCNLQFLDHQTYQAHHRQTHRIGKLCPFCGKLVLRQAMNKHLASHSQKRNFLCTECGKTFTLSENLKKHLRIHSGDKRYSCEFCNEKFIHWNSKRSHIRTVHTGEKKYQCTVCGKQFAQSSNMFRHIRQHTGEYPHECSYCKKKFISSPELRNHIVTHTKERNHICEICSKTFGTKKSLSTHMKTHTGERNYVCSICSKAFTQAHVLRTHLKMHPECPMPPPGVVLSQRAILKKQTNLVVVPADSNVGSEIESGIKIHIKED